MTAGPECLVSRDAADAAVAVTVRYFAGARAAAGVPEETLRVAGSATGHVTVANVIDAVLAAHPDRLTQVVTACSFLLDGVAVRDRANSVADGALLDVLPPFAGG